MPRVPALSYLNSTPWADWEISPITGDASTRKYFRLSNGLGKTAILMDAGASAQHECERFADISALLIDESICAPRVQSTQFENGLMILEDLGSTSYTSWLINHPDQELILYQAVLPILEVLQNIKPSIDLFHFTPDIAAQMLAPFFEFAVACSQETRTAIEDEMTDLFGSISKSNYSLSLRDFHADNLIWRSTETAMNAVGVLDFQDALIAPIGYDLVSLVDDARRDVSRSVADHMRSGFLRTCGMDKHDFDFQFALLSAQRNLRILGIFMRLANHENRREYLQYIPRVMGYVERAILEPRLSGLAKQISPLLVQIR